MHSHTVFARAIVVATLFFLGAIMLAFFIMQTVGRSPIFSDTTGLERINVGGVPVWVAIADTATKRQQGLSGTESLADNQGLLFVFERDGFYSIWMKDMQYEIDVLWLEENGTIISGINSLSPDSYPETYTSPRPARYILELPAGFLEQNDIQIGERVTI